MATVNFRYGEPNMVAYTPGADVKAGDVIVTNLTPRVAHVDIPNGTVGALAAEGGIYSCAGDAAIAADKKVYWNATNKQVTETAAGNTVFGVTVTACSGAAAFCDVRHDPSA
jgi:predicted RecA/RadA family phage recombinase